MKIDVSVQCEIAETVRVRMLSAMFDCPITKKCQLHWECDLPIETQPWNVGLIVGPSGSGKTTIARHLFGDCKSLTWNAASVIDDFSDAHDMQQIAAVCQAVGFNTIPAWMRRYSVLSNGEKFRVELARRLLELDPIVIDEFTSVVDRQVAQIGAHAVQKYVRKNNRKFVGVSCHYDIIDWMQPDWILDASTMAFTPRGSLQRRPALDITISRVPYATWRLFAPFHYMTNNLHRAAQCYALFVGDRIAAFAGMLHRPHAFVNDIMGLSRLVTLPDWQGLGLAMILSEKLAAAYRAIGKRFHTYPAHPSLIRSFDHSPLWNLVKKPGTYSPPTGNQSPLRRNGSGAGLFGGRPCAVFEYCGEPMTDVNAARLLISSDKALPAAPRATARTSPTALVAGQAEVRGHL